MSTLVGQVAVVTGGAKGIGRAAVEALAREGASVAIVDTDLAAARALAADLGESALAIEADVSSSGSCARAAADARDRFGRIDILVNSAGIQRYGDVVETPEEVWDEVLGVNLKSMFLMAKRCVPVMLSGGGGAIVNVASVQGFASQRGVAAYAASKGGAIALTRSMAVDHAPDIRVNCVCPGSVDTPMLRGAAELFEPDDPDGAIARWGRMHLIGRVARPDEVGDAIAYLAGPRASFITGTALMVDGGLLTKIGGT